MEQEGEEIIGEGLDSQSEEFQRLVAEEVERLNQEIMERNEKKRMKKEEKRMRKFMEKEEEESTKLKATEDQLRKQLSNREKRQKRRADDTKFLKEANLYHPVEKKTPSSKKTSTRKGKEQIEMAESSKEGVMSQMAESGKADVSSKERVPRTNEEKRSAAKEGMRRYRETTQQETERAHQLLGILPKPTVPLVEFAEKQDMKDRAKNKKYRDSHLEQEHQRMQDWYEENKDKVLGRMSDQYQSHRIKKIEKAREKREAKKKAKKYPNFEQDIDVARDVGMSG